MRHLLFTAVLSVLALAHSWSVAGPANGPLAQGREGLPDAGRMEQSKDQRRSALRQALVQRQEAAPAQPAGGGARQLSPAERAELRRQLRDQSTR
jgi:hypothetical protein